jgi:hypothetical protein
MTKDQARASRSGHDVGAVQKRPENRLLKSQRKVSPIVKIKADRFLMLNRHEHDAQKGSGFAIETSRELRLVIEGEDNR